MSIGNWHFVYALWLLCSSIAKWKFWDFSEEGIGIFIFWQ